MKQWRVVLLGACEALCQKRGTLEPLIWKRTSETMIASDFSLVTLAGDGKLGKTQSFKIMIGGWESRGGVRPGSARRVLGETHQVQCPVGFLEGRAFQVDRRSGALRDALVVLAFEGRWPEGSEGLLTVGTSTDNAGNPQVLSRLMTSKFRLIVVCAEFAAQLDKKNWRPTKLEWILLDKYIEVATACTGR